MTKSTWLAMLGTTLLAACVPGSNPSSDTAVDDTTTGSDTSGETGGESPVPVCGAPDVAGPHTVVIEDRDLDDPLRSDPLQAHIAYPADGAGAPYPLVVLSHGFSMYPQTYDYLFELLASHGFVVVGTKHRDSAEYVVETVKNACETIPEAEQGAKIAEVFASIFEPDHPLRRPADLSHLIDHAEALTMSDPALVGLIDTTRVGAVGHSFGGFTSLMVSGAQVDSAGIAAACAGGSADWLSQLVIGDPLLGLICFVFDSVSDQSLSQPFDVIDERVSAVATLAGPLDLVWGSSMGGLGAVDMPTLMVYTDTDLNVDYAGTSAAYASFHAPKHFLTLLGGTHGNFGTLDYAYFDELAQQVPDSCTFKIFVESMIDDTQMPTLSPEDQNWLTGVAVAAFLQHHLAGATGCEEYLSPEYYESLAGDVVEYSSE